MLPVVRTKAENPGINFYTWGHAQSGIKLCSWLMFSKDINESEKYQ